MKFAIANQFFMVAHQAGVDYANVLERDPARLPARRRPARAGLRRRAVPLQGHDAARGVHERPLPDGPVGDAGQRGDAGVHRERPRAAPRDAARPDGRDPGDGLQGGVGRQPRSLSYKLRKLLAWARRDGAVHRPVRARRPPGAARDGRWRRPTSLVLGVPHRAYRDLDLGDRDVVDVWGALGRGIAL